MKGNFIRVEDPELANMTNNKALEKDIVKPKFFQGFTSRNTRRRYINTFFSVAALKRIAQKKFE